MSPLHRPTQYTTKRGIPHSGWPPAPAMYPVPQSRTSGREWPSANATPVRTPTPATRKRSTDRGHLAPVPCRGQWPPRHRPKQDVGRRRQPQAQGGSLSPTATKQFAAAPRAASQPQSTPAPFPQTLLRIRSLPAHARRPTQKQCTENNPRWPVPTRSFLLIPKVRLPRRRGARALRQRQPPQTVRE